MLRISTFRVHYFCLRVLSWFLYLMTSLYPEEAISLCLLKLSITTKLSNDIWGSFCLLGSLKYLEKLLIPLSPRNIFRWKKLLNLEVASVYVPTEACVLRDLTLSYVTFIIYSGLESLLCLFGMWSGFLTLAFVAVASGFLTVDLGKTRCKQSK